MSRSDMSLKEYVIHQTKSTGILPCIKLHQMDDYLAYAQAMYDGGARVIEVTMTTPGVLEAIKMISDHFGDKLLVAAGTVLDPTSAREVIMHGSSIIVNPCVIEDVIDVANRYNVPVFSGAFTATEVFTAMRKGATMVKIFPGALGGPKYMTNLKMVFPEVNLIPPAASHPKTQVNSSAAVPALFPVPAPSWTLTKSKRKVSLPSQDRWKNSFPSSVKQRRIFPTFRNPLTPTFS
ncbi:MAG: bifunctional 4-hydroxy-2-oxoglutarate aldolase/2-dehydro-3-deoxy-phosphogluconate aldolase [Lentisphaeria bacterium]|nr:bifunctional 4-hydroxy-2-oxoglutarate aldolase/2-dehydro-3-deoxy-phosphogluconate aldolase [Lentisphaeria bacterium]